MSRSLPELVLGLLPASGGWMLYAELLRRAAEAQLEPHDLGTALTTLCAGRQAVSEHRGGYQFVRRLEAGEDPPVARPVARLRRPRAHTWAR